MEGPVLKTHYIFIEYDLVIPKPMKTTLFSHKACEKKRVYERVTYS